ncbi:MAG TPA: hypothetical protein VH062_30385 [Polyangiaceae bacterium]|nr:hypothetical protein [Polyangiaceae bacterium]
MTHLFADGGRIIKSTRTDYTEHLGDADMQKTIRRLMKDQHKAMFIALRDGQLNETIDRVLGPMSAPVITEPPIDVPSLGPPSEDVPPPPPGARRSRPPPTLPNVAATHVAVPAPEIREVERSVPPPIPRRASPTLTDLVLADLESARSRPAGAPAPANAAAPTAPVAPQGTGARPPVKGTPLLGTPATAPRPSVASGRYAPARPANIFSTPPEPGSIFGGSSISEQSLDEVILSYLAEDLDGTSDD